jgi:glycerophosphoryl diester phosphodiesterase
VLVNAAALDIATLTRCVSPASGRRRSLPVVIAHRGASGYRPEHTLAAYELAARLGADFLEPDLVATKDGVLVCRHEPDLGVTTNIRDHPAFTLRKTVKAVDGATVTGWFVEDFTLDELRTLRAIERFPRIRQANTVHDGRYEVPTFTELLQLRRRLSRELGHEIGVYPETKHPTYFQSAGLALEPLLIQSLESFGLNHAEAPVFVQSFEVANLRWLRQLGLRTGAVQLLAASGSPFDTLSAGKGPSYADLTAPGGLAAIGRYAQGIGPDKRRLIPLRTDGNLGRPTNLVDDAHATGLLVHAFTFRAENSFLPCAYRTTAAVCHYVRAIEEQITYLATGIDGLFTDQPDLSVLARADHLSRGLQTLSGHPH